MKTIHKEKTMQNEREKKNGNDWQYQEIGGQHGQIRTEINLAGGIIKENGGKSEGNPAQRTLPPGKQDKIMIIGNVINY